MLKLKLRKIGGSVGIVLPKEMLRRLNAKAGHVIIATATPSGYALSALGPTSQKQVEAGEDFMERDADVLTGLSNNTAKR